MRKMLLGLLALWAAASGGTAAFAAEAVLELREGTREAAPAMELFRDAGGERSLADVQAAYEAGQFVPARRDVPNDGYGAPVHWARIEVRNATQTRDWLLSVAYPPLDRLQLYVVDASGRVVGYSETGDALPFAARAVPNRNYVFPVALPVGEHTTLYLRAETEGALALPVTLATPERFVGKEQTAVLLLGGYYGIMLIMIIYNSVLALSMRSKAYLYYVYINLSTLFLYLTLNGTAYQYVWPDAVWWNNRAIVFFICLSHVAALLFTRNILQLKQEHPRLYRAFSALIGVEALNIGVLAFDYPAGLQFSIYSIVAIQLVMIAACLFGWRRGSRTAKFFLLGWGVFMVGAMLSSLSDAGWLPMSWWTTYASQAGSAFQAVVLSWGLADHIQRICKEKERAVAQMKESRRLADTDELTGLNNRRCVNQAFETATRGRPGRAVSFMMIDVDHFKRVNDTYGHEAGDYVLREIGQLMLDGFPRTDVLGRFGGEEFMVLMPDTTIEGARVAADRLIGAVRERAFVLPKGQTLYCTVSIGVAQWKGGDETFLQLVRRADEALYEAKREGRNRVSVAGKAG
ncbi:diguanylate cyclase [Paenibacillus sp.]|uniref:diguanylate cyclase n=1 Tax=Paenibacillus sp. TaxID=58172 RepID=UPI002D375AD1|nr:diguanylate cyclase [Paenibacillus sp.]HZG57834.1 diguanylate cyclase [Paenibacillus sp.]